MADQFTRNAVFAAVVAATVGLGVYLNAQADKEAAYKALPKAGPYYGAAAEPSNQQAQDKAGYTNCVSEYRKTGSQQVRDMCNAMRQSYLTKYSAEP